MPTQDQIILKIRSGDSSTLNLLYEKYFNSIAKYILQNSGTIEDTKDIFQDAIMVLYNKSKDDSFVLTSSIHTYLFSICKNLWLKKIRNKSIKSSDLLDNLELTDENTFEYELNWRNKEKLYRHKFSILGEECQKLLSLFLQGMSMDKISSTLRLSSAAYAKKKKYKCKLKLIELIKSDPIYASLRL